MRFDDDEEIVVLQNDPESSSFQTKRTKTKVINKTEAPLEKTKFSVMLELTGVAEKEEDRLGVDLVTVLDISGSMKADEKLEKLKFAMSFLIHKLGPIDRLSVVTFENRSHKVCPLRQINDKSQKEIEELVMKLDANGGTNIRAGLETALKVLNGRKFTSKRSDAIMLMSDGDQNHGDASQVEVGDVPVYTFGFGNDYKPDLLNTIANNSADGTFSVVQDLNKLNEAFSQCLAGLLSVVVQDLKVTFTPKNSTIIEQVCAGKYPQSVKVDSNGVKSVTVSFGFLYETEVRKVIVYLLLPAVPSPQDGIDILEITHSYSPEGEAKPRYSSVNRVLTSIEPEVKELVIEEMRNKTARSIKEAREEADNKRLEEAKGKLKAAIKLLDDVFANPDMVIKLLKLELEQLLELMKDQKTYDKQGRAFALASETSHALQRFASRGDVRAFATELMNIYLEQAKSYDKQVEAHKQDPSIPLPKVEKDPPRPPPPAPQPTAQEVKQELAGYIETVIQSLKSIKELLTKYL